MKPAAALPPIAILSTDEDAKLDTPVSSSLDFTLEPVSLAISSALLKTDLAPVEAFYTT